MAAPQVPITRATTAMLTVPAKSHNPPFGCWLPETAPGPPLWRASLLCKQGEVAATHKKHRLGGTRLSPVRSG